MKLLTAPVLAVVALFSLTPAARSRDNAPTWHEPHGRYTLTLPAGWKLESNPEAASMKISNGSSWAIFETSSSNGESLALAQQSARQMQPMYANWTVLNQGAFETALHHPAGGITVQATVTTRTGSQQVVMLFVTQSAGQGHFVSMTSSAPQSGAQAINAQLMSTFNSVRFAGE